jgi:cytochrome P450
MARDPEVWGKDCCEFKPFDRFVEKTDKGNELKRYRQVILLKAFPKIVMFRPALGNFMPSTVDLDYGKRSKQHHSPEFDHPSSSRFSLGQTLAMFEATSVIASLVQRFDISFPQGWWESQEKCVGFENMVLPETPMYKTAMTLPMKYDLMIQFRERS